MSIHRFEEIHAWQAARDLCKVTYKLSRQEKFTRDYGLRDQMRRAAISTMANIAEGFDSRSNLEFIQFLYYALRSASELQSHLYVAQDQGYVSQREFSQAYEDAKQVKRMVFGFIDYLRTSEKV